MRPAHWRKLSYLDNPESSAFRLFQRPEAELVDLAETWDTGNINSALRIRQMIIFKEEASLNLLTQFITEMVMRFLEQFSKVGVPDGI